MKKLLVLLLSGLLVLGGCTTSNTSPDSTETPDSTEDTVSTSADVIIVGAGGAGLTAAIEAADAGKSVIILEKLLMTGGNTVRSTGGMNAANTPVQDEMVFDIEKESAGVDNMIASAKADYPELAELTETVESQWNEFKANPEGYFDTEELFMLDTLVGGNNINNHELVTILANQSKDSIAWLETFDASLSLVGSFGGASVKRIHKPVNDEGQSIAVGSYLVPILTETAKEKGVEIIFETEVTELVVTDNAVTGVKAGDVTYDAKSVIIATGGFGYNLDMVLEYKPEYEGFVSTNSPSITGDGIKMAQAIGAATVDMEQVQIHPTVHQETSALITEGLRGDGAIMVNNDGVRFCNEVGTRDDVSASIVAQPDGGAWLVVDQKMVDASAVIAGYISKGYTVEGSTVEELATAMNVDSTALTTTLDTWNAAVDAGNDAEFGRTSFANKLDTGNFYAIYVAPGVHHTMGGLEINANTEVLNESGEVISGLYAAGEVTGGIHGSNRLGGNAVSDVIVFGRIAGQNAAAHAE